MTSEDPVSAERMAKAFGPAVEEYERGRPRYPAQAIERLTDELALGPNSVVVDLAAGTGKLTRDLVPRFGRVIAIEPLEPMLRELRQRAPGAKPIEGSAENLPLAAGTVDAVLVAQAFHWFDGDRALAEIARVLRPSGGLALLWNSTPRESREGPWFSALDDLLERRRVDLSTMHRHASGRWRDAFERDRLFAPLATSVVPNPQRASKPDFIASLASRSYIAVLEPRDREALLSDVEDLFRRPDAPLDGDAVVVPIRTDVHWARLAD
jgi:SAM-dependent methyltransferase